MKDYKTIKTGLQKHLPRGYTGEIQRRLNDRGIRYSRNYIASCCNPDKQDVNQDILFEALKLVDDTLAQKKKIEELSLKIGGEK